MLALSCGVVKKKLPESSSDLESVYETRALPQWRGRWLSETVRPSYQESPMDWNCPLLAKAELGRPRLKTAGFVVVGMLRLRDMMSSRPRRWSYPRPTEKSGASSRSTSR